MGLYHKSIPTENDDVKLEFSSLKYVDRNYVPSNGQTLTNYISNEQTEKMIKFNSDYKRVLKAFGFEDDGKSLDQVNDVMSTKLGKVKAILIATGSTGDVLPVAQYVKHLGDKLPWLDISGAALATTPKARELVKQLGFQVEEFMHETRKDLGNPDINWFPEHFNRFISPSSYAISYDYHNSMNRCLKDAQVVFFHDINHIYNIGVSKLLERSKGNRLFIDLYPAGGIDSEYNPASVSKLREQRLNPTQPTQNRANGRPIIYGTSGNFVTHHVSVKDSIEVGPFRRDLDPSFDAPNDLNTFLVQNKNKKIVYFGLGSMSHVSSASYAVSDAQRGFCEVMRQLGTTHYAYIWQQGIGDPKEATKSRFREWNCPEYAFHLRKYIPHSWLFPRINVAIHHGGSGTTHEALYSGIPSVICPIYNHAEEYDSDQPLFSKIMNAFGYGVGLDYCNGVNMPTATRIAANDDMIHKIVKEGQKRMHEEFRNDVGSILVAKYLESKQNILSEGVDVKQRQSESSCLHFFQPFHLKTLDNKYCSLSKESGFKCNLDQTPVKPSFQLHHIYGMDNDIEVPISGTGYLSAREKPGSMAFGETATYLVSNSEDFVAKVPQFYPGISDDSLEFMIYMKDNEYDHCIRNKDLVKFEKANKIVTFEGHSKFILEF